MLKITEMKERSQSRTNELINELPKHERRPKWSLVCSFLGAMAILAIVVPLVVILVRNSIWVRLELLTGVLSFFLLAYLFVVLFYGVYFDKTEKYSFNWFRRNPIDLSDAIYISADTGSAFAGGFTDVGPLGCLLGFLLDIIASAFLIFLIGVLIWFGVNFMEGIITAISISLFLLFRRSLRYVVAKGRSCRGNIMKSFLYAIRFTIVGSIWFYFIFYAAYHVSKKL
jgi:hypothetical protein